MAFQVVTEIHHKLKGKFAWIQHFIFMIFPVEKTREGEKAEISHSDATISALPGP